VTDMASKSWCSRTEQATVCNESHSELQERDRALELMLQRTVLHSGLGEPRGNLGNRWQDSPAGGVTWQMLSLNKATVELNQPAGTCDSMDKACGCCY
jgi:hypothetical protein